MSGKCLVCYAAAGSGNYHAACAKRLFGSNEPPSLELSNDRLEELALRIINRRLTIPGVQKKLSLSLNRSTDAASKGPPRLALVGALGGTHILKPPSETYPEMPEVENLTMRLAGLCGIKTAKHGLIKLDGGKLAYVTRRFDRSGRKKIPVEDLCQLSGVLTENKYKSTHESIGKVIRKYSTNPGDDVLRFFEIALFSFLTGNSDMHLKNYSMAESVPGQIGLAPAYDLLCTQLLVSDPEETALPLNGKKNRLKGRDFRQLARNLGIPERACENVINDFKARSEALLQAIDAAILSKGKIAGFKEIVRERFARLEDTAG